MKGVIENVWQNESRNGQAYLTVQIDGERYNIWDKQFYDKLEPGEEIGYEVKQSGDFRHLTNIELRSDGRGEPAEGGAAATGDAQYRRDKSKDAQIRRMSCLKSASELLGPFQLELDLKIERTVGVARYLERYVTGEELTDFPFGSSSAAGKRE